MKKDDIDFGWKSKRYRLGYLNAVKELYGDSKDRESHDDRALAEQGSKKTPKDGSA
ncbi:MAG TPA: hypothetical protein VK553_12160 [Candidatus Nitrosopolaris rasttigaisensis]|nr:hypothetical protein [Candidatus Nitrosopolaris rasttigaisensis]